MVRLKAILIATTADETLKKPSKAFSLIYKKFLSLESSVE